MNSIPRTARTGVSLLPAVTTVWVAAVVATAYTYDFAAGPTRLLAPIGFGLVLLVPRDRLGHVVVPVAGVAYLAWYVVSSSFAGDPGAWSSRAGLELPLTVSLVAVAGVAPLESIRRGVLAGVEIVYAYVLVQAATGFPTPVDAPRDVPLPGDVLRWHGPFYEKNGLGGFVIVGLSALLTLARPGWRRRAGVAASAVLLVGSRSTTAIVGCAVALGLAGVLAAWDRFRDPRSRPLFAVATGIGLTVAGYLSVVLLPALTAVFGKDPTLTGRTDIWAAAFDAWIEAPITGLGVGFWASPTDPLLGLALHRIGYAAGHAHNGLLNVAVELGLVGVVLVAILLAWVARTAWRALPVATGMARFGIVYLATLAVSSLSEAVFQGVHLAMVLALGTALAGAVRAGADRSRHTGAVLVGPPSTPARPSLETTA